MSISQSRILVVDDKKDSADSLAMLLRLKGNEVRTAHDGLEAVEVAEIFHPRHPPGMGAATQSRTRGESAVGKVAAYTLPYDMAKPNDRLPMAPHQK